MNRTVFFVALGCPKNRVDTERMMGIAAGAGLQMVTDPGAADVIVVNTCGFIGPAQQESVDTILEMAQHKEGRCQKLVVTGCLSQRFPQELAQELPEVDHFLGTAALPALGRILEDSPAPRNAVTPPAPVADETFPRALAGPLHSAYLKIAEGCDRRCAFCIIPTLRGPQKSRTVESLVQETEDLVAAGAREVILVAQDTTAYGRDLGGRPTLSHLLQALDAVDGLDWIRVLYTYPSAVDPQLIETVAQARHVVPYLDIPFQHVDDQVLRQMRRGYSGRSVVELVATLRQRIPQIFIRGTVICGHPRETQQAHQALLDFVRSARLDHLGAFSFSPEPGTASAEANPQVPSALAQQRCESILSAQRQVSRKNLQRLRGQILDVLVEGISEESEYLLQGRHPGQAPEVDGLVILTNCGPEVQAGDLIRAQVVDSGDYDLVATAEF